MQIPGGIPGNGIPGLEAFGDVEEMFGGGMEAEKNRAKRDQLQAAKDMNDAKKDTYDKATIQNRN